MSVVHEVCLQPQADIRNLDLDLYIWGIHFILSLLRRIVKPFASNSQRLLHRQERQELVSGMRHQERCGFGACDSNRYLELMLITAWTAQRKTDRPCFSGTERNIIDSFHLDEIRGRLGVCVFPISHNKGQFRYRYFHVEGISKDKVEPEWL